jgi:glycosyltransferase involved in cell wall biosynthesis
MHQYENMTVAVIVPVYNAEKWVREAVGSIIHQEHVGEVVLVEDGSTDSSLLVCEQLAEEHREVHLFRHLNGRNLGPGASRNVGVYNSKADVIAFLDADDICLPGRFHLPVKTLTENPQIDGVYEAIGTVFEDEAARAKWDAVGFGEMTTVRKVLQPEELFYYLVMWEAGHFSLDGLTMRKNAFEKVGGVNESLRSGGEDTDFCIRLSAVCKLAPGRLTEPVAMRRVHSGNEFVKERKDRLESRLVMNQALYEWAKESNQTKARQIILLYRLWKVMARSYRTKRQFAPAFLYFTGSRLLKPAITIRRKILGSRSF